MLIIKLKLTLSRQLIFAFFLSITIAMSAKPFIVAKCSAVHPSCKKNVIVISTSIKYSMLTTIIIYIWLVILV